MKGIIPNEFVLMSANTRSSPVVPLVAITSGFPTSVKSKFAWTRWNLAVITSIQYLRAHGQH